MKPGYKQTEVGVIPDDWEVKPLGECASFRTGPFGSALHKSDYTNDGIPVVNPMHINDGRIEPTRTMTITEKAAKLLADFRLKAGEIVIGRRGDMGRCAVVMPEQDGWLCGTGSMIIRVGTTDVDFLQRVISSPRATAAIEETSVGSTMINLNQSTLAGLKVQFPPLPEQRAIATALSDVDGLLGALDRLIAKKRDLKQAAMQQLLTGQTRLPGFRGEWEVKTFGQLYAEPSRNGIYKSGEYQGRGTRIVNMGEMFGFDFISDQEMNRVSLTAKEIAISGLQTGDLLFGRRSVVPAGAGKCALVVSLRSPLVFESSIIRVRLNQAVANPLFSYYFFASSAGRSVMSFIVSGTNVKGIRASELRDLKIPHPSLHEQTAIAEVLSDMDAELAVLEQRREKTRALKQGMMQELLTGRTRLV
jgi:type I restriction enzyme S subunit